MKESRASRSGTNEALSTVPTHLKREYRDFIIERLSIELFIASASINAHPSESHQPTGTQNFSGSALRTVDERYERLLARRSVRFALKVAGLSRPIFRWWRSVSVLISDNLKIKQV